MFNNIGDLSAPVTKLIKKVSNAVGVIYEPTHIKRIARAEADAERIKAVARLELVSELQQRGLDRLIYQEGQKQANIESITAQAAELLAQDAEVERLDEDWLAHFFKQCDSVSDTQMQYIWARLLAREADQPDRFSKRTIAFVATIDKDDAKLFTTLCQFNWVIRGSVHPLIFDVKEKIYRDAGLHFAALSHLASIGMITFSGFGYSVLVKGKYVEGLYHGSRVLLGQDSRIPFRFFKKDDFYLGQVVLTQMGEELASICKAVRNKEFYEYVVGRWRKEKLLKEAS